MAVLQAVGSRTEYVYQVHEWTPETTSAEFAAREILSAAMWLHSTLKDRVWLWRGQAISSFGLEPAMHTRVLSQGAANLPQEETTVIKATQLLLKSARKLHLDKREANKLPDLALLAHLQHHGAATPLLDVSTDPLIALWMIAFADAKHPERLDKEKGALFGILRPPEERWIRPLDARKYSAVAESLSGATWWYQAPDVTERLRIQRGSFLVAPLVQPHIRSDGTIPLNFAGGGTNTIANRLNGRGKRGNGRIGTVEAFKIIVPAASKKFLRKLLEDRSGLSIEVVYPTPWHQPFIVQFATAYGRQRDLGLDLNN